MNTYMYAFIYQCVYIFVDPYYVQNKNGIYIYEYVYTYIIHTYICIHACIPRKNWYAYVQILIYKDECIPSIIYEDLLSLHDISCGYGGDWG
jgi:hypothetical protein